MAGDSASASTATFRAFQPASAATESELAELARLHRASLPHTASSRAGDQAVRDLYRATAAAQDGIVLLASTSGRAAGFASGTTSLRATESWMRSALPFGTLARLILLNLRDPRHLLARRRWEKLIPGVNVGYVLTIGVSPDSGIRGSSVLATLEDHFRSRRCQEAWVDTEASNARALRFYERNGYHVASTQFGQVLLRKLL